jgi:hypothetical protein
MCYDTKIKSEADPPHVIDFSNLPHDTQVKVTLVARTAAHASCANVVQVWTWYINEHIVCSFLNIFSHQNHLLLFVKLLAMHIITRKYRIRQLYANR